jgi:hypothetical protein
MPANIVRQGDLMTLVIMVVVGIRMARAIGWMGELDGAKQIQGSVRCRGGYPDGGGDHGGGYFVRGDMVDELLIYTNIHPGQLVYAVEVLGLCLCQKQKK